MAVISITRLRIRSWRFIPSFFYFTARSRFQALRDPGNHGLRLLREPGNIFWTATAWDSDDAVRHFMTSGPHGRAMGYLLNWCDEAVIVRWTQDTTTLPTWHEAHHRLAIEGRRSKVLHPSPAHDRFEIPPPKI